MTGVEKVAEYLEKAKIFYLLTAEDGKPSGRPFTFFLVENGDIIFLTGQHKKVYQQMKKNPYVELLASDAGSFMRIDGEAEFFEEGSLWDKIVAREPLIPRLYNDETGFKVALFRLRHAKVEIGGAVKIQDSFDLN